MTESQRRNDTFVDTIISRTYTYTQIKYRQRVLVQRFPCAPRIEFHAFLGHSVCFFFFTIKKNLIIND